MKSHDWLSNISDMMSGLMMIFLFVSISYMLSVQKEKQSMRDIAVTYQRLQKDLYKDLYTEFEGDLPKWQAEIDSTDNTVTFNEPSILFESNSADLKTRFQAILNEFFPRYLKILSSIKYKNDVQELRIEGHTSSDWEGTTSTNNRYLNNAKLSQERAFNVLQFCFCLKETEAEKEFLTKVLRANGLAFAKPKYNSNGKENYALSRRVEFRVITKTEEKIAKILEVSNGKSN